MKPRTVALMALVALAACALLPSLVSAYEPPPVKEWVLNEYGFCNFEAEEWAYNQFLRFGLNGFFNPEQNTTLGAAIWIFVFCLPIIILNNYLGRMGFVVGAFLMTIVFAFSTGEFLKIAVLNFVALGVMLYRGGLND